MHNLMSFGLYYYHFFLTKLADINKILITLIFLMLKGKIRKIGDKYLKQEKRTRDLAFVQNQKFLGDYFLITTVPETDTGSLVENTKA